MYIFFMTMNEKMGHYVIIMLIKHIYVKCSLFSHFLKEHNQIRNLDGAMVDLTKLNGQFELVSVKMQVFNQNFIQSHIHITHNYIYK